MTPALASHLLSLLLAMYPGIPAGRRACIEQRRPAIVERVVAAEIEQGVRGASAAVRAPASVVSATGAERLLDALLALYRPPALIRTRINARRAQIAAQAADASAATGVPVGLIEVVGMFEGHLGQDHASGGSWGSPVDRFHRRTAGGAWHMARDLAASLRACGNWPQALRRYRTGRCDAAPVRGYQVTTVLRAVRRIYTDAHLPVPDGMDPADPARR